MPRPQKTLENLALAGPATVAALVGASALLTSGRDIYLPRGAGPSLTLAVQSSWVAVGLAANPRRRPLLCSRARACFDSVADSARSMFRNSFGAQERQSL
jgi:hypothetical protein